MVKCDVSIGLEKNNIVIRETHEKCLRGICRALKMIANGSNIYVFDGEKKVTTLQIKKSGVGEIGPKNP